METEFADTNRQFPQTQRQGAESLLLFSSNDCLKRAIVKDDKLFVTAGCDEDKEQVTLHKKMLRTLHLPEQADTKSMHCDVKEGILTVEMPLILPQKSQPVNPSVVPIVTVEGRRKISLQIVIGSDFTIDDLQVHSDGQRLTITASYEAEVGRYGEQVARRELKKEYSLPEHISIENTFYELRPGGTLYVDIFLKDEPGQPNYRCDVTTEDISGSKQ